jgi:recombination protein RecT
MSNELAAKSPKNDLRSFIAGDTFKQQVALALPRHMTPDRFARVALTAITRTPKLLDCTRESLLKCLMDCSQFGLEPDGRHAHLIPYKDQCTLIIDYKGLMALARRSGQVSVFRAELVKEHDEFDWHNGMVTHSINWRLDRGKTDCVYSYVKFQDGSEDWEVLTLAEVNAIRARSRAKDSGPWVTDFDEMAKKTAIRRHSKRLTLSPEFQDAIDRDDDRPERTATGREIKAKVPDLLPPSEESPVTRPGAAGAQLQAPNPERGSQPTTALQEVQAKASAGGYVIADVARVMVAIEIIKPEQLDDPNSIQPQQWASASAQWKEIAAELEANRSHDD